MLLLNVANILMNKLKLLTKASFLLTKGII